MLSRQFRIPTILILWAVGIAHAQQPICSINSISKVDSGLELHFVPDSGVFVRISNIKNGISSNDQMFNQVGDGMHKFRRGGMSYEQEVSKVILKVGEEAFIGTGPHSSCIATPDEQGETSGVTVKMSVSLPGIEPQTTSQFLAVHDQER